MKRLILALLVLLPLTFTPPTAAQQGADPLLAAPALPAPPPAAALPAPEAVLTCRQALADPGVQLERESPWVQYQGVRSFDGAFAFSPPRSILLAAGGPSTRNTVGQEIRAIAAGIAEVAGSLRLRLEPGIAGPGDTLRVELYETTSLAPDGLIAGFTQELATFGDGNWRAFEWELTDDNVLQRIRGRETLVYTVSTFNANGGSVPRVWLDDLTLNLCANGGSLAGQVRRGSEAARDADLLLVRSDRTGEQVLASARTASDGSYRFEGVPALPAGATYRIWFVNNPPGLPRDDTRLGFWAGPLLESFGEDTTLTGLDLNIADLPLVGPASYAQEVATDATPARLTWSARAGAVIEERHRLCLYDREQGTQPQPPGSAPLALERCGPLIDPATTPLSFDVGPESFVDSGLRFSYGRAYNWYVLVCGDPACQQYGYSFYERTITFLPAPLTPPTVAPTLPSGDPASGTSDADWTLLVYVAADNALGDPTRAPRAARPATQLAGLQRAATANPRINFVSYLDGFGAGGAALCAYKPNLAPDCRARAEPDTGAPQALATFLREGRARYPASRIALLIIAPGNAVGEMATDEGVGGSVLTLAELGEALAAGLEGTRLELVIFQAPNMGSVDTLRAVTPYARTLVAAPDQVWQLGALEQVAQALAGFGRVDTIAAARGVVSAYQTALDNTSSSRMFSMTAYDLSKATAVISATDDLAFVARLALDNQRGTLQPALLAARRAAQGYDSSGNGRHNELFTAAGALSVPEDALVDLQDLARILRDEQSLPDEVQEQAQTLLGLFVDPNNSPVLRSIQRPGLSLAGTPLSFGEAGGLALFFPSGERLGGQPTLSQRYLYGPPDVVPGLSDWAPLLRQLFSQSIGGGPGGVTAAPGGGAQFRPLPGGFVQTDLWLPLMRR